jgi:uridine phosphorylase
VDLLGRRAIDPRLPPAFPILRRPVTTTAVTHLKPSAELAERVLLPGDPHRALAVAQALLEKPARMFNHSRGLWGYSGIAVDGELLTIQSTGMGGPSAAIVCEELIALGAGRLVRIGTCAALDERVELGALLAAETVLALDGASAALGADGALAPDPLMLARLVEAGAAPATVASRDLPYDGGHGAPAPGAVAVELETAAVLGVAARHGVPAAAVLGVARRANTNGAGRLDGQQLEALGLRLGDAGYAALRSQ